MLRDSARQTGSDGGAAARSRCPLLAYWFDQVRVGGIGSEATARCNHHLILPNVSLFREKFDSHHLSDCCTTAIRFRAETIGNA